MTFYQLFSFAKVKVGGKGPPSSPPSQTNSVSRGPDCFPLYKTSLLELQSIIHAGLMGLCMGFSVVSFCELIYYLFLGVQAFLIHNIGKK